MTTTLVSGATTIGLSDDLFWSDENQWLPVNQTAQRTITGATVISSAAYIGGRPITLQPIDASSAWMSHATLDSLRNLAAVPGKELTLTLRGQTYDVIFRHQDGTAITATPVIQYNDVQSADYFLVTIKLMEL